jgi:hypothetical protein
MNKNEPHSAASRMKISESRKRLVAEWKAREAKLAAYEAVAQGKAPNGQA